MISGATTSQDPENPEIRAEMERVLASPEFANSEQLTRFLTFVIREETEGRGEMLKERSIAIKALGRDADFDPRIDSIVRVLAGKLRRALERYYGTDGATNPIHISIPKGGYQPVFSKGTDVQAVDQNAGPPERPSKTQSQPWPNWRWQLLSAAVLGQFLLLTCWTLLPEADAQKPNEATDDTEVEMVGVLPYRIKDGKPEVLLVRTLRDSHWTIPKAPRANNRSQEIIAEVEAFKEAGVAGKSEKSSIGQYHYERNRQVRRVIIHPLLVNTELPSWPEDSRKRKWCDIDTAANLVASDGLARVVREFRPL